MGGSSTVVAGKQLLAWRGEVPPLGPALAKRLGPTAASVLLSLGRICTSAQVPPVFFLPPRAGVPQGDLTNCGLSWINYCCLLWGVTCQKTVPGGGPGKRDLTPSHLASAKKISTSERNEFYNNRRIAFLALCKDVKEDTDMDYFLIKYRFSFSFCFYSKSNHVCAKNCYIPPPFLFFLKLYFYMLDRINGEHLSSCDFARIPF